MNPSLSVIVPVCNAEGTLAAVSQKLLETLPDLTERFEIVIVDDASIDHTADITGELRRTYPQVRVLRHGWQWGLPAAILTGRSASQGELVLVLGRQDEQGVIDLVRQWKCNRRPVGLAEHERAAEQELTAPLRLRTEPAHRARAPQREPSFLRHLRQLSAHQS